MQRLQKGYIQKLEVKDFDLKSGTFIQKYTRYNVKDSDGDYGRKGMFTKTWSENFRRIRHLLNHDDDRPLGEPVKFWEDNDYAYLQSQLGTNDVAEDFKKMVDSNLIKEASYGYTIIRQNKVKDGNELIEVKLWEVSSLTGWGANQFTEVVAFQKSLTAKADYIKDQIERYAALDSFCRKSDATDKTLQNLEQEKESIYQSLVKLLGTTHAVDNTPEPNVEDNDGLNTDEILSFIQLQLLTS